MSANPEQIPTQDQPQPGKKGRETVQVRMTDGRTVEFGKTGKMLKSILVQDGTEAENDTSDDQIHAVRFDYVNGETRTFELDKFPGTRRLKAHGMSQKFGDEGAGTDSVDDIIYDIDTLVERVGRGVWSERREGGTAGVSLLAQALVEYTKQSMDQVRALLVDVKPAEKLVMRGLPELKPIIDRLEAERASKANVDRAGLLARMGLKAG